MKTLKIIISTICIILTILTILFGLFVSAARFPPGSGKYFYLLASLLSGIVIIFSWKKSIRIFAITMLTLSLLGFSYNYIRNKDFTEYLENNKIASPSGNYQINASLYKRKTFVLDEGFKRIKIHLLDENGSELSQLQTGLPTHMMWTIGWMQSQDIVVLHHDDYGNWAWTIDESNILKRTELNDNMRERAWELRDIYIK